MKEIKPTDFNDSVVNTENTVSILAGQDTSSAIFTMGLPLLGMQVPMNFTPSNITFLVSLDNGATYAPLQDVDGLFPTAASVPAGGRLYLPTTWLAGFHAIKLVTSVAQVNAVDIILGLRRVG